MTVFAEGALFLATALAYLTACGLFIAYLANERFARAGVLAPRFVAVGAALHASHILVASYLWHVCPVEGIHFAMSVVSVLACGVYLVMRRRYRIDVVGAFVAPLALTFLLASRLVGSQASEPSQQLKSAIIPIHVTVLLLGYALFTLAFAAAVAYLLQERLLKSKRVDGLFRRLPPLDFLDRAEHRFLLAGFPLLTIGILTGTLWARHIEAGSAVDVARAALGYATWLLFAGVLLLRAGAGWRGRRAAYGTIAGFGFALLVLLVYLVRSVGVILVVGLSHRTAPVEVREKFATGADTLPLVLARLAARPELREVMFLSTCNRIEVLATPAQPDVIKAAARAVREELARHASVTPDELEPYVYAREGEEAIRHVFRVAASLDSMVLGEPQILGQVKDAYDAAMGAGTLASFLGRCVNRAFTVAKRVRSETALGAGTVSISSVAVDLARNIFGDLADHSVLLLGAGEMAEAAAKSLGKGARHIRVCNRSFERGAALANSIGGDAVQWDSLGDELTRADVVVASTSSRTFVVTQDLVKRAMKIRKGRTLFFVDIAVPRNVEPSVHTIDNVYVYNVDDLEQEVARGLQARHGEVAAAEAIVDKELKEFKVWARGLNVAPTVVALRAKTRAVLMGELERSLGTRLKHLPEGDRAALSQMIESAVNKLLHAPTTRLKASATSDDPDNGGNVTDYVRTLKHLFDLPEMAPPAAPSDPRGLNPAQPPGGASGPSVGGDDDGEGRLPN